MRIEMPEKRKKYDREFREGAVRIVEETGKSIAAVAVSYTHLTLPTNREV